MNLPAFSVVIPAYNRAGTIRRAINSVLTQQGATFEVIVVDDGSTDHTFDEIGRIRDVRIISFRQNNSGRSSARNAGAKRAQGRFLTFLDSDDEALPGWLDSLSRVFEDENVGIVCCGYLDAFAWKKRKVILPRNMGPMYESQDCQFRAGTFAMRRELFEAIGGYSEDLAFSENTELAMRLVPHCTRSGMRVASIHFPYIVYHRNVSRKAKTRYEFQVLLQAANFILEKHGDDLRNKFPKGYANYCGIAGVNAARLNQFNQARRFFVSAISHYPYSVLNYARLALTLFPSLATKLWLRHIS